MDVDLYLDPSCRWSWAAYQWLDGLAPRRQLRLRLLPFSLALRDGTAALAEPLRAARDQAHRSLRVLSAIEDHELRCRFFSAFSSAVYDALASGRTPTPDIAQALAAAGLDPGLLRAADETRWDTEIRTAMAQAATLTGAPVDDQKIPVLVLAGLPVSVACTGPLLDPAPAGADGTALWDDLERLLRRPDLLGVSWRRAARPISPATPAPDLAGEIR